MPSTTQPSQFSSMQYQMPTTPEIFRPVPEYFAVSSTQPKCQLNCKCCAIQATFGLVCSCNKPKESVGTQTGTVELKVTPEEYFKPKTSAYKMLQVGIFILLFWNYIVYSLYNRLFKSTLFTGLNICATLFMSHCAILWKSLNIHNHLIF